MSSSPRNLDRNYYYAYIEHACNRCHVFFWRHTHTYIYIPPESRLTSVVWGLASLAQLVVFELCLLAEHKDFIGDSVTVTFQADDTLDEPIIEAIAYVNIIDDNINEANQVFLVKLDFNDGLKFSRIFLERRQSSLAKIIDNDRKYNVYCILCFHNLI